VGPLDEARHLRKDIHKWQGVAAYSHCREPHFVPMTKEDLKEALLEMCAEDYYGVWELYWNYQGLMNTKDVDDEMFIATLQELAAAKKVAPFDKKKNTNEFEPTTLDLV
jgi:hypothetical protein